MTTVGSFEAKTHLSQLLERVARGERITITKHGRPVAVLVPPPAEKADVEETVRKLIEFGKGRSLGGLTVREMVEEGRRF
ncbi:type II toxin-antitoxin system Phd/YefM family antitoxin [Tautonia sociabilis]|uniref:Antitoxin n=1 Tax=Tautonia sociabilis TaxID=2080755 RepID=A0A432MEN2_9BACT|nr:type II toxin-antitoxin system prevent-host-death family antitoxin [Tautonia sociabilis]RUL84019.1 type II toxin-antitoxin system Phd/YefM family antitoxin [Tautonia sociabilis]